MLLISCWLFRVYEPFSSAPAKSIMMIPQFVICGLSDKNLIILLWLYSAFCRYPLYDAAPFMPR